ncbi:MAG: TolC family protein, partial [Cyclobacteriaceae bacterium]|nr:TolC family protein [Cyclobacteriaceae bacterium]
AFQNWEDATRSLELYDKQIELVQQQINLLTTSFSNGSVPFSSVLKSQLKILNYQIKRIEAITLQYQSLSLLEKLSGINLINT